VRQFRPMYSGINEALQSLDRRARPRLTDDLPHVADPTLLPTLASRNSQVIIGREGSGKTHILLQLERELRKAGYRCAFVRLETVGSASDLYGTSESSDLAIRATRLAIDALLSIRDAVRSDLMDNDELDDDAAAHLDALASALTEVRVAGEEERTQKTESGHNTTKGFSGSLGLSLNQGLGANIRGGREGRENEASPTLIVQKGPADVWLHLTSVRQAFEGLARPGPGLLILLDEWDSVPAALQPWLADLIRRLLWATPGCVVKIAAARPPFLVKVLPEGFVGLNDFRYSTIHLDAHRSSPKADDQFLLDLLHEHTNSMITEVATPEDMCDDVEDFIGKAFSDPRAASTLREAAERNPRDALAIAGRAAQLAGLAPISEEQVAVAAHWLAVVHKLPEVDLPTGLERWLAEVVLHDSPSRSFFAPTDGGAMPLPLASLYENRLLHKRGDETAVGLLDDPYETFAEWYVDFGYALQLLRYEDPDVGQIAVPPIGGYLNPADAPKFRAEEVEAFASRPFSMKASRPVPTTAFAAGDSGIESAVNALPSKGDFLIIEQDGLLEIEQLIESPVAIGRSVNAMVTINDTTVSRKHAELRKTDGSWSILDCGSANGTSVNEVNVDETELRSRDMIRIGGARLFFVRRALG
jgi:FHA domain